MILFLRALDSGIEYAATLHNSIPYNSLTMLLCMISSIMCHRNGFSALQQKWLSQIYLIMYAEIACIEINTAIFSFYSHYYIHLLAGDEKLESYY